MEPTFILAALVLIFLLCVVILIRLFASPDHQNELRQLTAEVQQLQFALSDLKTVTAQQRMEMAASVNEGRKEAGQQFFQFQQEISTRLTEAQTGQREGQQLANEQQRLQREELTKMGTSLKADLQQSILSLQQQITKTLTEVGERQKEKLDELDKQQERLIRQTEKRLDEMRATVDEKLQKTLDERLRQSFETVGRHLESVQKGLGEMQTLATDVGGLKKVLSNVKLRGGMGEVQLAMLLEQTLAPNQYEANVRTRPGAAELVEFAIKLPNRGEEESSHTWLPIDAKFPKDVYETLVMAYEQGDTEAVTHAGNLMEAAILKMGKDICSKYIEPPYTTDFAIMFLPFEGIYAEVARRAHVIDRLRTDCRVIIAGPTTLMALLNSLQMGFRTLAIQKRSGEVWKVLGEVKTEFGKYSELLAKAKDKFQQGMNSLDEVLGRRTRAMERKLNGVEVTPLPEPAQHIGPDPVLPAE